MFWHKDMACGVHLGILLMCLVQAEHVRCLWAAEAQSSRGQSRYVGFSQQDSGLKRFGGSYPQNQLRQASAQSSSFNTDTAVSSSYSQGLSNRGYAQTPSKPAQSGYPSVKLAQSSLLSKPNLQSGKAQEVPKRRFTGLSTAIASGSSVSQHNKKQNDLTDISKKSTRPVLQGTLRASKYPSSSSASVQSPSSKSKLASHQLIAQKASSAAETQAYYGQRAAPAKSSSLFSPVSPEQQKSPVRVKTSATAPARRVFLNHGAKASKPSRFSPQNERIRNNARQNEAGNPYGSKRFPVPGGNSKESYRPTSTSNQQNSRLGSQPRSLQMPTNERLSYKPSYPSTGQSPSSTSSLQTSWNSRNSAQGVPNLPASGNGRAGTSAQKFAPTRTYNIPQRFGGFSIRRLKEPADEKQVGVRKPEQTYTAPPQQSLNIRKPQQTYTAPPQQNLYIRKPQQTYTAPPQIYTAPPQQRLNIRKPQQAYTAPPQIYTAPPQQRLNIRKPQQAYTAPPQIYTAPPQQSLNIRKPQQTYMAPSQQSVSLQPQAESVHPPSTWKRFKPHSGK